MSTKLINMYLIHSIALEGEDVFSWSSSFVLNPFCSEWRWLSVVEFKHDMVIIVNFFFSFVRSVGWFKILKPTQIIKRLT